MGKKNRGPLIFVVVLAVVAAALSFLVPPQTLVGTASASGPRTPDATRESSASATNSATPPAPGTGSPDLPTPATSNPDVGEPDGATGAESAGDPYYPTAGNAGYDVQSYLVALTYLPTTKELSAQTSISAIVTEPGTLGRFSFDLQESMSVASVLVNGSPAGFEQRGAKLVITPDTGLASGSTVTVDVTYSGTPRKIAGGTSGLDDGGWYQLDSGGAIAIGEPFSASAWFPVNETPTDKALFAVEALVPDGYSVISNGLPIPAAELPAAPEGYDVFGWQEDSPMASYLSTIYIDTFQLEELTTAGGLPIYNAYGPGASGFAELGGNIDEYLDFLTTKFGPYPFTSSGAIFLNDSIGFALETQTRPVLPDWTSEGVVVHELAHQWWGDTVSIESWADICLNECFASYSEWLWDESTGGDLDAYYLASIDSTKNESFFWATPLVDMGAGNEFTDVYSRGPIALHALRNQIGDDKFDTLMLTWIEKYSGGNASWSDFEALVDEVAGSDQSAFMDAWFRKTGLPADEFLYPGDLKR